MTWGTSEQLQILRAWAVAIPQIARVYVFGSRARGDHRADSDLDLAVELDLTAIPPGSTAAGEWTWESASWREGLEREIGLVVDLEDLESGVAVVRPAVERDGLLVYIKGGCAPTQ